VRRGNPAVPLISFWCLVIPLIAACGSQGDGLLTVTVDRSDAYTFQGWGTSLAWWANVVGSSEGRGGGAAIPHDWSDQARQSIEHQLFDQPSAGHQLGGDWLGMTVARYNIGASPPTPADYAQLDYHVRDRFGNPCPKLGVARQVPSPGDPQGGMDLGRDSRQLNVMATVDDILHQQGATPVYEAFANSPPWWMTISGCPTRNPPGIDNLAADQYKAYADYLVNVIHQFHQGFQVMVDGQPEHKGIDFATLEGRG
jgi:hypothetical protein